MDEIVILVGTMSGTADMVADELSSVLKRAKVPVKILDMGECTVATLKPGRRYIVCTATYGDGDIPDNGQAFFDALKAEAPDLSAIRYGVVALGDRVYASTFCFAGKRFDELLASLGAVRVGERLENDASSGAYPDEVAAAWLKNWLTIEISEQVA